MGVKKLKTTATGVTMTVFFKHNNDFIYVIETGHFYDYQ